MEVVYKLAALQDPPLHFPLGSNAVALTKAKAAALRKDAEQYESWNEGLDRDGITVGGGASAALDALAAKDGA